MRKLEKIDKDVDFVATSIYAYCNFTDNQSEVAPCIIRVASKRKDASKISKDCLQKIIDGKIPKTSFFLQINASKENLDNALKTKRALTNLVQQKKIKRGQFYLKAQSRA